MTSTEWIEQAKRDKDALVRLVAAYHPAARGEKRELAITAHRTEQACASIRAEIEHGFDGNPTEQLQEAIERGSIEDVNRILNDAWFGVPESTDCWFVEGFREAVRLIEDLPEDQ